MLPVSAIAQVAAHSMQVQIAGFLTSLVATQGWECCHKDRAQWHQDAREAPDAARPRQIRKLRAASCQKSRERSGMRFLPTKRLSITRQYHLAVMGILSALFLAGCDISFASNYGAISNS